MKVMVRHGTGLSGGGVTIRAWIALTILTCGISVPPVFAGSPSTPADAREVAVVKTLLESLGDKHPPARSKVVSGLIARGRPAVSALLAVGRKCRDVEQVEAIVNALEYLDESSVEAYLLGFIQRTGECSADSAAWGHLMKHGGRAAIPAVISAMAGNPPHLKRIAERTLVHLLLRHDDDLTWDLIEPRLEAAPEETRARVIGSIGETHTKRGLEFLTRIIGRWTALDHAVVAAISQMPEAGIGETVVPHLQRLLDHSDVNVRRETVTALAVFGGEESARILTDLLENGHRGLRQNSLWALQTISGLNFPATKSRWKLWCDNEVVWWEAEGEELMEILSSGTDLQIMEAMQWLAPHRLYRNRFSPLLRDLLDHPNPGIREAAESVMDRLGLVVRREKVKVASAQTGAPTASPSGGGAGGFSSASHGFMPISRGAYEVARAAPPPPETAPAAQTGWLLPVVGLSVIGLLLLRIFGPAMLYRLSGFWSSGEKPHAPIVMVVENRTLRRRVEEPEAESAANLPDPSLNLGKSVTARRLRANRATLGKKPAR